MAACPHIFFSKRKHPDSGHSRNLGCATHGQGAVKGAAKIPNDVRLRRNDAQSRRLVLLLPFRERDGQGGQPVPETRKSSSGERAITPAPLSGSFIWSKRFPVAASHK